MNNGTINQLIEDGVIPIENKEDYKKLLTYWENFFDTDVKLKEIHSPPRKFITHFPKVRFNPFRKKKEEKLNDKITQKKMTHSFNYALCDLIIVDWLRLDLESNKNNNGIKNKKINLAFTLLRFPTGSDAYLSSFVMDNIKLKQIPDLIQEIGKDSKSLKFFNPTEWILLQEIPENLEQILEIYRKIYRKRNVPDNYFKLFYLILLYYIGRRIFRNQVDPDDLKESLKYMPYLRKRFYQTITKRESVKTVITSLFYKIRIHLQPGFSIFHQTFYRLFNLKEWIYATLLIGGLILFLIGLGWLPKKELISTPFNLVNRISVMEFVWNPSGWWIRLSVFVTVGLSWIAILILFIITIKLIGRFFLLLMRHLTVLYDFNIAELKNRNPNRVGWEIFGVVIMIIPLSLFLALPAVGWGYGIVALIGSVMDILNGHLTGGYSSYLIALIAFGLIYYFMNKTLTHWSHYSQAKKFSQRKHLRPFSLYAPPIILIVLSVLFFRGLDIDRIIDTDQKQLELKYASVDILNNLFDEYINSNDFYTLHTNITFITNYYLKTDDVTEFSNDIVPELIMMDYSNRLRTKLITDSNMTYSGILSTEEIHDLFTIYTNKNGTWDRTGRTGLLKGKTFKHLTEDFNTNESAYIPYFTTNQESGFYEERFGYRMTEYYNYRDYTNIIPTLFREYVLEHPQYLLSNQKETKEK